MSQAVTIELADEQMARLEQLAQRLGKTPGETTVLLIEERWREAEFPGIKYRDSAGGRQAYVRGTRLPVWQVVRLVDGYHGDPAAAAAHLHASNSGIEDALRYAEAFPEEIASETAAGSQDYDDLKRILPDLILREVRGIDWTNRCEFLRRSSH